MREPDWRRESDAGGGSTQIMHAKTRRGARPYGCAHKRSPVGSIAIPHSRRMLQGVCECYCVVKKEFDRLLPDLPGG